MGPNKGASLTPETLEYQDCNLESSIKRRRDNFKIREKKKVTKKFPAQDQGDIKYLGWEFKPRAFDQLPEYEKFHIFLSLISFLSILRKKLLFPVIASLFSKALCLTNPGGKTHPYFRYIQNNSVNDTPRKAAFKRPAGGGGV